MRNQRKPRPFLDKSGDLGWGVVLAVLAVFVMIQDSVFTGMGY